MLRPVLLRYNFKLVVYLSSQRQKIKMNIKLFRHRQGLFRFTCNLYLRKTGIGEKYLLHPMLNLYVKVLISLFLILLFAKRYPYCSMTYSAKPTKLQLKTLQSLSQSG